MDGGGEAAALPPATNSSAAPNGGGGGGGIRVENCYVFKSRLQEYAQKAGLQTPEYHTFREGPSHEPIFRSTVIVNNVEYDSLPGFFNRKAAEQSAAEVALMEIVKSVPANETILAVHETGLCKNLLQEYAQKMNYAIPSYVCNKQASGQAHFTCTVEIGGIQYIGAAARTKKEAEIRAARTALLAIRGQSAGGVNGATQYIVLPGKRQVKEPEKRPNVTPKQLKAKAKKGGFKKKWNKRKFIQMNEEVVNPEKAEAGAAGDAHDSNVPPHDAVMQEPSCGTAMEQSKEELRVENNGSGGQQKAGSAGDVHSSNVQLHDVVMQEPPCEEEPGVENSRSEGQQKAGAAGDAHDLNVQPHDAVLEDPPCETAMLQPIQESGVEKNGSECSRKLELLEMHMTQIFHHMMP